MRTLAPTPQPVPAAATQPPASTEASALLDPSQALIEVEQNHELQPTLFHPTLPLAANLTAEGCVLFDLETMAYIGVEKAARCADWLKPASQTASVDGRAMLVRSKQGVIQIQSTASGAKLALPDRVVGSTAAPCKTNPLSRFSPDGSQLALHCPGSASLAILDVKSGAALSILPIAPLEKLEQLGWGALGLVATARKESSLERCERAQSHKSNPRPCDERNDDGSVAILRWERFDEAPKRFELVGAAPPYLSAPLLDPLGRYCFAQTAPRPQRWDTIIDVATFRKLTPPRSTAETPPREKPSSAGWLAGLHPIFETVYTIYDNGCAELYVWRILTAPGKRGMRYAEPMICGPEPPTDPDLAGSPIVDRSVRYGDRTDESEHFRGVDYRTLERLSDHEKLIFDSEHAAHTPAMLYARLSAELDERVFRIGADPLTAATVRGGQLAAIYVSESLVDDFFDGHALPRPIVPAILGKPPRLRQLQEQRRDGEIVLSLQATDTGDGLGELRLWRSGRRHGRATPIEDGGRIELRLPIPTGCDPLRIYACTRGGSVCSVPVLLEVCAPKTSP